MLSLLTLIASITALYFVIKKSTVSDKTLRAELTRKIIIASAVTIVLALLSGQFLTAGLNAFIMTLHMAEK